METKFNKWLMSSQAGQLLQVAVPNTLDQNILKKRELSTGPWLLFFYTR